MEVKTGAALSPSFLPHLLSLGAWVFTCGFSGLTVFSVPSL